MQKLTYVPLAIAVLLVLVSLSVTNDVMVFNDYGVRLAFRGRGFDSGPFTFM